MTRNSRELSQFASFVEVRDASRKVGINTTFVVDGGVGIGQTVDDYNSEIVTRGVSDALIVNKDSFFLQDVVIDGDINLNGLEARLNVKDLNIRDKLINISLIEDPTNTGNLIPPNIGLGNTGDSGLVFARWDVGINTHKYGAIYWDDSTQRVSIATDVTETDPTIYAGDRYLLRNGDPAELEVSNLYVTNSTTGIKKIFETNQTDNTILNIVNVEIDAGTF